MHTWDEFKNIYMFKIKVYVYKYIYVKKSLTNNWMQIDIFIAWCYSWYDLVFQFCFFFFWFILQINEKSC